ncbi:hypothetical protein BDN71DRAFT_1454506 [Pleurotus eryngii]|uniref:Uncharacterized protein n=1 Tax=Pleurotus eryngii TaxID=5323 RepID=A0A9P6DC28_PLEER|nr:hypothetical protein BDN71DRAFT_1454506 [Pleurotus eryngii]
MGRVPNSLNIDPEGDGGLPMVFAASQDPFPVVAALPQDSPTSNDVERPNVASLKFTLHQSLNANPEAAPASEKRNGAHSASSNDGESSYASLSSGPHSSPQPTTEGPPTISEEGTETSNCDRVSP